MAKQKFDPLDLSGYYPSSTTGTSTRSSGDPLDLSGYRDPVAVEANANRMRELAAQVDAIAKDYAARGEPLSDDEVASLTAALESGQSWSRPSVVEPSVEAAPVVPTPADDPTSWEGRKEWLSQQMGEVGALADTAQAGIQDAIAGAAIKAADNPEQLRMLTRAIPQLGGLSGVADVFLPDTEEEKASWLDASRSFADAAKVNRDLADPIKEEAMARGGEAWRQYVETVFDVAGSPSSAASLVGGPAAALPFADVYLREYGAARRAGLSPEEADAAAAAQAIPEGVLSVIPAGRLVGGIAKRIPGVRNVAEKASGALANSLESRLGQTLNTATRAAATATGEGLEEGATFMAQDAARRLQGLVGPERAREYALEQVVSNDEYLDELWRNARAGAAMGGPVGAAQGVLSGAAEGQRLTAAREEGLDSSINTGLGNALLARRTDADLASLRQDTELNQDIAFEEQRIADEAGQRQAFEQAEKAAEEQRSLEEEAGFQTIQRDEGLPTSRVERYADVVERTPVNPPAEVTPERVAEQRAAEQRAADEQAERVRQGKLAEELRKRREAAAKKAATTQKKQTSEQKKAEKKRRDFIADQVLAENADATESELTSEFERRLADDTIQPPATTAPQPTLEDRVGQVRARMETAKKGKVTKMQNERIKAVVRRNPDLSVEEIAEQLRQEGIVTEEQAAPIVEATPDRPAPANVITPPTKSDKSLTEQEYDNLGEQMGLSLGMAAEPAEGSTTSPVQDFKPKVKTFVKALVGRTSKDSRDVQTLIHQGKIIVAPNAATLGRPESSRQAEYDMGTGKMYLYLDNMADLNDPVGHIAAALHETNHALLTPAQIKSAAGMLRVAANKGNTHAKNALRDARADTDARNGDDTFENEELIAYFASHTKAAEGKPLGSVGAVVRDLTSAAKGAIRKHVGLDLDVSIGEVATALNAALGDATTREIAGRDTGEGTLSDDRLGMLGGRGATDFPVAEAQGRTFTPNADRAGGPRFEFDDSAAELNSDIPVWQSLVTGEGEVIPLNELMSHPELERQYPDLFNSLTVTVDPDMPPSVAGAYYNGSIFLPRSAVGTAVMRPEVLRNTMLHEIQHAIQEKEGFVPGTNKENFLPTAVVDMKKLDEARVDQLASSFELGAAIKGLNPSDRAEWDALDKSMPGLPIDQVSAMFIQEGYHNKTSDRNAQRQGNRFLQAQENLRKTNAEYRDAERKGFDIYLRDRGEAEARNVETRSRMTQAERDALPFESTIGQDIGVEADDLLDTTPFVGRPERAPVASVIRIGRAPEQVRAREKASEFASRYPENPTNGNEVMIGKAAVTLNAFAGKLQLQSIRSETPGAGRAALRAVVDFADEVGLPVQLNPTPFGDAGMSETQLRAWYGRHGFEGEGEWMIRQPKTPAAPTTLGMAASQTPEAKAVRRNPTVVTTETILKNLFTSTKGLGSGIREAFEYAKSSPAGEEARANASLGKYNAALRQLAKDRGLTMEAMNDQIMAELDAIDDQTNGYDANIAAFTKAVSKFGPAGQHLLDLRNQVDALTKEMLRLRAAANVKPSAAEAKQLATLINNSGRYSHRLYAAHQGKAGKQYANAIMGVYNKGRKGKKLTPEQKDTYDMVERGLKTLIDDSLMIPDDAAIAEMGGDQLSRLYRTWGSNLPSAVSLDEMRDELAAKRDEINGDTDRLRVTAEGIAQELLGLAEDADTPIATYFRGSKQNRGILEERSKIPAELRALMGEITDPGTRLLATVAKQAEFVARTKFLLEVKNNIGPEHLQPPSAEGTPLAVNNSMERLSGEGYGPLNGWFASPSLRSMLVDVRETLANFEQVSAMAGTDPAALANSTIRGILNKWMGVAGWSKRLQIVGNVFLYPNNFLGAVFAPLVNGNINPATYGRGLLDAVDLIAYSVKPSRGLKGAEDAVTYGVTDSATVGELKGLPYEKIQQFAKIMSGKKPSTALRWAKTVGLSAQELYAMMDVWAKIANFHNEVNHLTSYYKKNGETRTEEQIKREAADIVNKTNITYKRAPAAIKALERGGITNFGTYFYEVFRSQIGNFHQGLKEMLVDAPRASTPSAKAAKLQRGMSRVGGQAAYWYGAQQLSSMLAQLMFGDDDEWDKRALLPEFMQNQDMFTVGYDENGWPVSFNVSRIDAFGPATDLMRQAMTGGMNMEQAKDELLNLYVRPRIVPQIWNLGKTLLENTAPSREPVIQHLTPDGYEALLKGTSAVGIEDKSTKAWVNLIEQGFGPGTYTAQRASNPVPVTPGKAGEGAMQMALVLKYLGASLTKTNPNTSLFFANKDYDDVVKIGRKDLANKFKDRPNITDDEIRKEIEDVVTNEKEEWYKLARVYRGMEAWGMSSSDINKAMKEAGLKKDTIASIKKQQFDPRSVSKASFEGQTKKELSDLSDEKKKAFTKEWKKAWDRLEEVSKENK